MPYRTAYQLNPDGQTRCYFMERGWNTQPPPYKQALAWGFNSSNIGGSYTDPSGNITYYDVGQITYGGPNREDYATCTNQCYAKLVNQLGNPSQWANNLLEANQAISGAAERILQVARFASKLRKGDVVGAAGALAAPTPKSLRGKKRKFKSFGDQFLEFHFGWVPLAQDIHSAMQTLSSPDFGVKKISATALSHGQWLDRQESHGYGWDYLDIWNRHAVFSCRMGLTYRVSNPNAYLASQLGLINPASIAWEAVPFSFVADWFGNVGQVLASATDFVGLDITSSYTTTSGELTAEYQAIYDHPDYPHMTASGRYAGKKFTVSRSPGITGPTLKLKPFKGLSLTRGITAISLLLQKL